MIFNSKITSFTNLRLKNKSANFFFYKKYLFLFRFVIFDIENESLRNVNV